MDFIDRLDLPDGQSGTFRTRIGYGESMLINHAVIAERVAMGTVPIENPVYLDAILRAFLVKADIIDYETSEMLRDVEPARVVRARPEIAEQLVIRAFELYIAWQGDANSKTKAATEPESDEPETPRSSPSRASSRRTTRT